MNPWLAAVRHDLLKRALWPARDLRDSGALGTPADLALLKSGLYELTDDAGATVTALALWKRLRSAAPAGVRGESFERALHDALDALALPWPAPLDRILALEPAFAALAREVDSGTREA